MKFGSWFFSDFHLVFRVSCVSTILPQPLHLRFYLPFHFSLHSVIFPFPRVQCKRRKYRIILIVQRALTSRQKKVSSLIFFVTDSSSSDTVRKSNPVFSFSPIPFLFFSLLYLLLSSLYRRHYSILNKSLTILLSLVINYIVE